MGAGLGRECSGDARSGRSRPPTREPSPARMTRDADRTGPGQWVARRRPRSCSVRTTSRAARAAPSVAGPARIRTPPDASRRARDPHEESHVRHVASHHGPAARPSLLGGALEDQDGRAAQDDHPRGAGRGARGGRLQHVPAALGRRLHRPADGLRHVRHERPPVGRDDARRRGVRGEPQLLPPRGGRPAVLRLHAHPPDAPGPRRGAPDQPDADQGRRPHPRQHVLHDDPPPPGAGRRDVPRRDHRRGARPAGPAPVQGQRGPRQGPGAHRRGRRRPDPVHQPRRDREHGRRPAGLDGERARARGAAATATASG